ncbi:MAG: cupin domain-containing protein, partial [Chloroflexi bacterium]|nr:cupin domain-containing protein [Chloroflexota bacterium]
MAVELELTEELRKLYADVDSKHMAPLWNITAQLLTREPVTRAIPYLWKWEDYWPLCQRSGDLVPIERGGERRVLAFVNPGLHEAKYATTHTLWAAVQYLQPGEVAPAHRHTPNAIRFIIQGSRAFTTVNGDKCFMERGDLVLTPNWTWHDHGHEGDEPMIWMDGLDIPLTLDLEAVFFEPYGGMQQQAVATNVSERRYRVGQLKPATTAKDEGFPGLLNYKWSQTWDVLSSLTAADASPYDDLALEYINPYTGGPVFPTLACRAQRIRPGVHTVARRQVNSKVYHVFDGEGCSIIAGQRFDWKRGDFFCVPTWAWHE